MLCSYCETPNEVDAKFCIQCGGTLSKLQKAKMHLNNRLSQTKSSIRTPPLLQAILDVSFHQFVSLKLIKVIYALSILFAGLIALVSIIIGFNGSLAFGIFMLLIGAPLIFLLIVLYSRVLLEFILFNFKTDAPKAETVESPGSADDIEWNV